jgi:capsular polysaccharide biosynthesis protein
MNEATSFDDVWSTLWAMRLTIVVAVVVGAVMGFGIHQVWPDRYRSTAVYTVSPLGTAATSGTTTQVNMDTEVVIATSDAVVDRAAKSLGVPATVISGALEVTVPQGSDALELAYTADSPSEAAKGANAVAAAYGENRSANAEAIVADARRNITVSIAETQALIDASAEGSPENAALQLQVSVLQQRLAALAATTLYPGTLVTSAQPPKTSTTPSVKLFVVSGVALGLLVGSLLALLLGRRRDKSLGRDEDEEESSGQQGPDHDSAAEHARSAAPAQSLSSRSVSRPEPRSGLPAP